MAHIEDSRAAARPSARRRRRRGVAVLVAVLAAAVAWPLAAAHQRGDVHVLVDALPITCEHAEVALEDLALSHQAETLWPGADITADMRCDLRFRVENRGSVTTRVERVTLAMLGPRAGAAVQAQSMWGGIQAEPMPDETDAIFESDYELEIGPSEAEEFHVRFVHRPDGCTAGGGGWTFWSEQPTVRVRALGLSGDRTVVGGAFGFRGTPVSDCGGS